MTNGAFYLDFPDIDDTYITIHIYHRDRSKEYSTFNVYILYATVQQVCSISPEYSH